MPELRSRPLFVIDLIVEGPQLIGATPAGDRRIFLVTGGSFEGDRLRGTVLGGGADAILVRPDDAFQLDVRITLQTDDGTLVYMTYRGLRHGPPEVMARIGRGEEVDPLEYYFRVAPFFETGSEKYAWLNKICTIGMGERRTIGPRYSLFEIL